MTALLEAMARAEAAYANHVITERDDRRWLLDGPGGPGGEFWAEVSVLAAGTVFVQGSGMCPVVFGFCGRGPDDAGSHALVHALARPRPDDAYLQARVTEGMGRCADVVLWDNFNGAREASDQMISAWAVMRRLSVLLKDAREGGTT